MEQGDVERLRGTVRIEYSLARAGAEKLWRLLHEENYIPALGALTGNQAVEMAKAGLKAIYLSGWQVAADANLGGQMYPDQSLYPVNSVPSVVRSINNALMRADQIAHAEGQDWIDWMLPIVADAEAGFGGALNAFELMKSMIEAGAAAVHFEDQLSSAKKCGHMGGKVLVPTREAIQKLIAARLAADVLDVPTILIARTDANAAQLITSDCDPGDAAVSYGRADRRGILCHPRRDRRCHCSRSCVRALCRHVVVRDVGAQSRRGKEICRGNSCADIPGKLLAYNCSPSFHWRAKLNEGEISPFQRELGAMGYRFQFVTLAGFHALNLSAFELAHEYVRWACRPIRNCSSANSNWRRSYGYGAVKHQRFVGTGYFDDVANTIAAGQTSIRALPGSTEEEQFDEATDRTQVDSDFVIPVSGD